MYPTLSREPQSTQTTVFLAAESPEICMIPVDTAVDA